MSEGVGFLDIFLFAMVAVFLVLRLRSVLGRRTGAEKRPEDAFSARPAKAAVRNNVTRLHDTGSEDAGLADETPLVAGLTQIRLADPSFDVDEFLTGTQAAFEIILSAFADGDKKGLRPLVAQEVFDNFVAAIDARAAAGETLETVLVRIKLAELLEARMEGHMANVTVKLVSEQVNISRDSEGNIVSGDANRVSDITDIWTFARDTRSRDPNWQLIETRSPN